MPHDTKFFIDPAHPGIVRGGFFDGLGGILVGMHAQWVCDALNEKLSLDKPSQPKAHRLHVFVGRMKNCKSCGLPRTSPQHMVPHE